MTASRSWVWLVLMGLGACGGRIETGDGGKHGSTVPGVASGGTGGQAPSVPVATECPAAAPQGYEQCAVAPDVPCTYVESSQWLRCSCPGDPASTRTWSCEGCFGCHCPAEIPQTGDSCEDYPGATPCPSAGVQGYCSCSPCLTWECSLEAGSVAGGGGWSTCDG